MPVNQMVTTQLKSNVMMSGELGRRDGRCGCSWLLDAGSRMLRCPDCVQIIDRKHLAALNLPYKVPISIITSCQSATIEYDSCGVVCFFRP